MYVYMHMHACTCTCTVAEGRLTEEVGYIHTWTSTCACMHAHAYMHACGCTQVGLREAAERERDDMRETLEDLLMRQAQAAAAAANAPPSADRVRYRVHGTGYRVDRVQGTGRTGYATGAREVPAAG